MREPFSFAFPDDLGPAGSVITCAARAFRISRWSRALHNWLINGSVPDGERIVNDDRPWDRRAVYSVYASLEKNDAPLKSGTINNAMRHVKALTWTSSEPFIQDDCECILDLLVAIGMAVRTTPDGEYGDAVYEYPPPTAPTP